MNKRQLVIFLLFFQLCFGQTTFKIDEGDLLFISWKSGLLLQKPDGIFTVEIYQDKGKPELKYIKVSDDELVSFQTYKTNVYKNDILKGFDFDKLRDIKFFYFDEEDEYYYFLYNDFLLASFRNRKDDDRYYLQLNDVLPYVIIEINKLKFLYYFEDSVFIIPTHGGTKVLVHGNYNYETIFKTEKHSISEAEANLCSKQIQTQDNFIEPEPEECKCQLKNQFGQIEIKKEYDSIFLKNVIVGYSKKKVDLYNYQFKKFNKKPLQAFHIYENVVQFIENNELLTLDYNGTPTIPKYYQNYEGPWMPNGTSDFGFYIRKENENFTLEVDQLNQKKSIALINMENIENIYFQNNQCVEYFAELSDYQYCPIYYKLKNGSYGIGRLEQLINPDYIDNDGYYTNYQNLQYAKAYYDGVTTFKLKKDNLFMFYPLQWKQGFRYKAIEDFKGYFARFELPNGQKGWLSRNGKEYIDD